MTDHFKEPLHNEKIVDKKMRSSSSGQSQTEFTPPDGGWGWLVCFTSMLTNGTVFGVINTFGIIYVVMVESYASDDENVSFKTSFVGSVCTGVTFLMCIVSSILSDRIGIRPVAVTGAVLGTVGLVASAFVTQLEVLYLTYGVLLGLGAAFTYSPSLVILGHYFKRHMGLVNGLVAFGSAIFTIALSLGLPRMLAVLNIKYTFLVLAGLYFLLILCAFSWKPLFHKDSNLAAMTLSTESVYERCTDCCSFTRKFLDVRIFRNRSYVIWCLSMCVALFGYFVPFVHLVKHTKDVFPGTDGNLLVTALQITSGIGRLVFGKIADLHFINRIILQQSAFLVMGIVIACIPFSASYGGLVAISLIFGLTDGIFVCLLGPIAFDLVGSRQASQAIGFLLGFFSLPFVVGPPVAGILYDTMKTYDVAFYCAGATPIIGALMMCLIPRVKNTVPDGVEVEHFASISMLDLHSQHIYKAGGQERPISSLALPGPSRTELQVVTFDDLFVEEGQNGHIKRQSADMENISSKDNCPTENAQLLSMCDNHRTVDEKAHQARTSSNENIVSDTGALVQQKDDGETGSLLKEVEDCLKEQRLSRTEVETNSADSDI